MPDHSHDRECSDDAPATLEQDGSISVHRLVIPPSELWSREYKSFHVSVARDGSQRPSLQIPARNASKEQWDEFGAQWDQRYNAALLRWALERYPADVIEGRIAGVRVAIVSPKGGIARENERRLLINLHGGGFVYNHGLSLGQIESLPVASAARIKVITLDYRQAPFHGYPAGTEDVAAVYRELLRDYDPGAIGMFGCSAGGTLTTQAVSWFQSSSVPLPGAIGVFNIAPMPPCDRPPWGAGWGESGMWFSGIPKHEMSEADRAFWEPVRWYMESAGTDDSRAYPGLSDTVLARFPPTLFLSGTRDFALSSVVFSHARLLRLGVDSSLYIMEGGGHGAHVVAAATPEAHDANTYIARWFTRRLAQ